MWFLFLMWLKITASEQEKACRRACGHMRAFFCLKKNALMIQKNISTSFPHAEASLPTSGKEASAFSFAPARRHAAAAQKAVRAA